MFFVDPHGYERRKFRFTTTSEKFQRLFFQQLQKLFEGTVQIIQTVSSCDPLQTATQGGNCVTWTMLLYTMFSCHSDAFQTGYNLLLQRLSQQPILNIIFFSFYLFITYVSYNQSLQSLFYSKYLPPAGKDVHTVLQAVIEEDSTLRKAVSGNNPEIRLCSSPIYRTSCPGDICAKCGEICSYKHTIRLKNGTCTSLHPRKVLKDLFRATKKLVELGVNLYMVNNVWDLNVKHLLKIPSTLAEYQQLLPLQNEAEFPLFQDQVVATLKPQLRMKLDSVLPFVTVAKSIQDMYDTITIADYMEHMFQLRQGELEAAKTLEDLTESEIDISQLKPEFENMITNIWMQVNALVAAELETVVNSLKRTLSLSDSALEGPKGPKRRNLDDVLDQLNDLYRDATDEFSTVDAIVQSLQQKRLYIVSKLPQPIELELSPEVTSLATIKDDIKKRLYQNIGLGYQQQQSFQGDNQEVPSPKRTRQK